MNLDDCLILNLQIGSWIDKRLPRETFVETIAAVSALRNHFYAMTLPWKGNGDRLITRALCFVFLEENAALCVKFDRAVDQLEFRFGAALFPRDKFYVTLDIDTVSQALDGMLNDSKEDTQARITQAVARLYEKLSKPLEHFADKMSDADCVFRDTTVSNLKDIVDILPTLNFTNDATLTELGERIEKSLTRYEAKDLRTNKVTRKAVADEAREILTFLLDAFGRFTLRSIH